MKKIILTIFILLINVTLSFANFSFVFVDTYKSKGIDDAVVEAMKQGVTPNLIVEYGLGIDDLNPQNLVKAMYCAGIPGNEVRSSSLDNGISEMIVVAGYKKSVEECGDKLADSQAYTPVSSSIMFSGPPSPGSGVSASPSTF